MLDRHGVVDQRQVVADDDQRDEPLGTAGDREPENVVRGTFMDEESMKVPLTAKRSVTQERVQ
ncbi:hypothetical protein ACGFMK_08350 [Amycolatopsis sp. NPDC049252]|uniref:hypothetical protein n=1 Tax=Amycolatopsis sp. NPDC049252 TaxID=3363933 RepID=UPI003717BBF0